MIKTYILYSYGMVGYRTYLVKGEEKEAMNKEIPDAEMPRGSVIFFGKQGYAKMVLRHIADGQMTLFIEQVPSPHKDPLGRNIPCNIQFIGNAEEDGDTLKHLAIRIASNLTEFGEFFQTLISDRGGLHIAGDELKQYILDSGGYEIKNSKIAESILNSTKQSGVIFLSTYGKSFNVANTAARQVMEQLNFTREEIKGAVIIPADELSKQLKSQDELKSELSEGKINDEKNKIIDDLNANIKQKDEEINRYRIENKKLINENEKLTQQIKISDNSKGAKEIESLKETISMYKREYGNIQKKGKILLLVTVLSIVLNIILLIAKHLFS